MKIMTIDIMKKLPALYANDQKGTDAKIIFKLFYPDFNWTWYVTEGAPIVKKEDGEIEQFESYKDVLKAGYSVENIQDWLLYGLVTGYDAELGYFTLNELLNTRGILGCQIERDLYFGNPTLGEVMEKITI